MRSTILALAAALCGIGSATLTCKNITVPVNITARNGKFPDSITPRSGIEVTNFILNLTRQGTNFTETALKGYATISGTYNIAATYCQPLSSKPKTLQILTHGVGFDRYYWDLPFQNHNYSYTNVAVNTYNFATLAYDRLGIGDSSHGDPLNFVQSWTEMAALEGLTKKLRAGSIDGIPKFKKVVHVGHSYGSIQTASILQRQPEIWDGVALTGFSTQILYFNFFELAADFINARSLGAPYPPGYFAPAGGPSLQESLLAPDAFDPAILDFLEKTGTPPAVGEFLTLIAGNAQNGPPNNFTGPAIVVTGEYDLPFCGGNCYQKTRGYESLPAMVERLFPMAKKYQKYQTVIVPKTGHGLNLQYSHPFTYKTVNEFFIDNGLGP